MISISKVDHFVLTTEFPEESANFYQALGFTVKKNRDRYELYAGDFKINLHFKGKELKPHAYNIKTGSADFCLEIDGSIVELNDKLKENGIMPETEVVSRNGVRGSMNSIYLRDPDGNLVELSSYVV